MKPNTYKNTQATSTINVNDVAPPFKVVDGVIVYVDSKTGRPLSEDIEEAKVVQQLVNSVRVSGMPTVTTIQRDFVGRISNQKIALGLSIGTDHLDHFRRHLAALNLLNPETVKAAA